MEHRFVASGQVPSRPRRTLMLVTAFVGFTVNLWAWALLAPLGPRLAEVLRLSPRQQALVVEVPVLIGSTGRIPVGALADRFGGRLMFVLLSLATAAPAVYLGLSGHASFSGLLVGGFFLGIGGTAFAAGVPFLNGWFPPARRGWAFGVFGMGVCGTAISALTTVRLTARYGIAAPFAVAAVVLVAYAALAALVLRDAPGHVAPPDRLTRRLADALRLPITWRAGLLYTVVSGGFAGLSAYLPAYLTLAYRLAEAHAATLLAGFVLVAVLARPAGGWLADRYPPTGVLAAGFTALTAAGIALSATPPLAVATVALATAAAAFGIGSGATLPLMAALAPPDKLGSVAGVVGASAGLGGFALPLLLGSLYAGSGSYRLGLLAVALVAASALVFTTTVVRRAATAGGASRSGRRRDPSVRDDSPLGKRG